MFFFTTVAFPPLSFIKEAPLCERSLSDIKT